MTTYFDKVRKKWLTRPYQYQVEGVKSLHFDFDGRALLADDMGLGKSASALWYAMRYLKKGTIVVVCPASLKWIWQREARTHAGMTLRILETNKSHKLKRFKGLGGYVINYDILGAWKKHLKRLKPDLVVIDECQAIKSRNTQRTKNTRFLCQGVRRVLALGGTGGMNSRPAEIWTTLNIIRPDLFPSFFSFASRYCQLQKTPWGWEYKGATRMDELHAILKQECMVRRKKEDVLKDLPEKTRIVVPITIDDIKTYKAAESNYIQWLRSVNWAKATQAALAERLTRRSGLKRLIGELKFKNLVEWINQFMEESDDKLLVYGVHKKVLYPLHELFVNSVIVTGEVTGRKRQVAFDHFNLTPKYRLFFGNLQAAGVGWSCKSATNVMFAEMGWTPGEHTQAEDRCRGVGRGIAGRGLFCHYLVGQGTIEEKIMGILEEKQTVLDGVLDGGKGKGGINLWSLWEESVLKKGKKSGW